MKLDYSMKAETLHHKHEKKSKHSPSSWLQGEAQGKSMWKQYAAVMEQGERLKLEGLGEKNWACPQYSKQKQQVAVVSGNSSILVNLCGFTG